jgi:hypothetical protein
MDYPPIVYNQDPPPYEQISNFLISNAKALGTNVIVHTGDATDSGDEGDYQKAWAFFKTLKDNNFIIYHIPGNHDYCKYGMLNGTIFADAANLIGSTDTADSVTRRERYRKYIDPVHYPYIETWGNCIMILLDSMGAELDNNTGDGLSQGKLGDAQLSFLEDSLHIVQEARGQGKKVIVAIHHSPFHYTDDANNSLPNDPNAVHDHGCGLNEVARFLDIVENKIDCLLFGHVTPDGIIQKSFPDEENFRGIPIINCENMEHAYRDSCHITVIDLQNNSRKVYDCLSMQPVGTWISPTINSNVPIVYNGASSRPVIAFQPGDKVTVIAGGGVQTGGRGDTWKRYVNPSGDNSDHLYFGQIHIPGITSGLTAIRDLVTTYNQGHYDANHPDQCTLTWTIPTTATILEADRFLKLHYLDDDYSDNGYDGHDDGTDDQCKNVGPAYVQINIQRGSATLPVFKLVPIVNSNTPIVYNGPTSTVVAFQSGDKATVTMGGGVNAGNSVRKTWKRYVNPSGNNTDKYFFGKIHIPGITKDLIPIRDLVTQNHGHYDANKPDQFTLNLTIPSTTYVAAGASFLKLHYMDFDYGDNGYFGHDDGTEDQCKNVGQAFVNITIKRGLITVGPFKLTPMVSSNIPIVYDGVTVYVGLGKPPAVSFQVGDIITVAAGGGVQTGGVVPTWKRFVNPSGLNSDHLYFGQMHIPGITTDLTAVRDLVNRYNSGYDSVSPDKCTLTFNIPNIDSIPESDRFLKLHYIDDVYNDNQYDPARHDAGSENQCVHVGPAYVRIDIQHAGDPGPTPTHEQIALCAYYHWQSRGCPMYDPLTDWYWAENYLSNQ